MKPALVILAAGESRRLGECKALVDIGGATPLERLVTAGECCDGAALVVTGAHHAAIAARAPQGVEVLENIEWKAGRTGGIALAHRERPRRDLLLAPVDCPLVPAKVFEQLVAAWLKAGSPANGWLGPRFAGRLPPSRADSSRFGHPVLLGRELLERLETFSASTDLRELRPLAAPFWSIDVEALEVLDDLDCPADLNRIRLSASR